MHNCVYITLALKKFFTKIGSNECGIKVKLKGDFVLRWTLMTSMVIFYSINIINLLLDDVNIQRFFL